MHNQWYDISCTTLCYCCCMRARLSRKSVPSLLLATYITSVRCKLARGKLNFSPKLFHHKLHTHIDLAWVQSLCCISERVML